MGFYRLSMSVECAAVLSSPAGGVLPVASNTLSPGSDDIYVICISNYIQYTSICRRRECDEPSESIWFVVALNK